MTSRYARVGLVGTVLSFVACGGGGHIAPFTGPSPSGPDAGPDGAAGAGNDHDGGHISGGGAGGESTDGGLATGGDASTGAGGTAGAAGGGSGGKGGGTGGSSAMTDAKAPLLHGVAVKGPFVSGGTVQATALDATGAAHGSAGSASTDLLGRFALGFDGAGLLQLDATGGYFDELSGTVESTPITLHGVAVVTDDASPLGVNALTHMTYARVKQLLTNGEAPVVAVTQAESELRVSLRLGGTGFDPGASGSTLTLLTGDGKPSAYLLALSSVSSLAATVAKSASVGDYLDAVQSGMQANGTVPGTLISAFDTAHRFVEPDAVRDALSAYFSGSGFANIVPDLNRALDTDLDGVANSDDDCLLVPNTDQTPVRGVCAYHRRTLPAPPISPAPMVSPGAIPVSGDLDGDGDLDAALVSLPDTLVFINDGSGGFSTVALDLATALGISRSSATEYVASAALGAVDAGAQVDLVVSVGTSGVTRGGAALHLLPGNGDGTFAQSTLLWKNQPDVCVALGASCTPAGTPCCTGACAQQIPGVSQCLATGPQTGLGPLTQLLLVDVNGDKRLDVVGAMTDPGSSSSNGLSTIAGVLTNPGAGSWSAPKYVTVAGATNQTVGVYGLAAGQLTKDSNVDLLAVVAAPSGGANLATSGLHLLTGDGKGGFTVGTPSVLADGCTAGLAIGDFDDDAKPDVALVDQNATKLRIAFGDGNGVFGAAVDVPIDLPPSIDAPPPPPAGFCPKSNSLARPGLGAGFPIAAGHFTGSTHWDVAVGQSIFVTSARAAPTEQFVRFAPGFGVRPTASARAVPRPAVGDYDGDGNTDLLLDLDSSVVLMNPPGYRSF